MLEERRERLLGIVKAMLEHRIYARLMKKSLQVKAVPDKAEVVKVMKRLHVVGDSQVTLERRSQTVRAWVRWALELAENFPR